MERMTIYRAARQPRASEGRERKWQVAFRKLVDDIYVVILVGVFRLLALLFRRGSYVSEARRCAEPGA